MAAPPAGQPDKKRRDRLGLIVLVGIVVVLAWLNYNAVQRSRREQALPDAVMRQDVSAVRSLLDQGGYSRKNGEKALVNSLLALRPGSAPSRDIIRALLEHGISPNVEVNNVSVLYMAVIRSDVDVVRLLLSHGANIGGRTGSHSLVMQALMQHNASIAEVLLEHGADPNASSPGGETALLYAVRFGEEGMVRLLLAKGADPNGQDGILQMARNRKNTRIIQMLTSAGAKE